MQKRVNLVDLVKSFQPSIYLQDSASIQPAPAMWGAGREARRRLAGGACNGSHPVFHSAPKQRGVVSRVCPHSRIAAVSLAEFVAVHIVLVKLPVAILMPQQFRVKYYYSHSSFRTPPVPSVFEDNPVYRRRRRRERAL